MFDPGDFLSLSLLLSAAAASIQTLLRFQRLRHGRPPGAAPHLSVGFQAGLKHPSAAEPAPNMLKGAMLTICRGHLRLGISLISWLFTSLGGPGGVGWG